MRACNTRSHMRHPHLPMENHHWGQARMWPDLWGRVHISHKRSLRTVSFWDTLVEIVKLLRDSAIVSTDYEEYLVRCIYWQSQCTCQRLVQITDCACMIQRTFNTTDSASSFHRQNIFIQQTTHLHSTDNACCSQQTRSAQMLAKTQAPH